MTDVNDSILNSTKKLLGLEPDYDPFDMDITIHINAAFATLTQLGVGPVAGLTITGVDEVWDAFIGSDPGLNPVRSYVYLRVRLLFDPPTNSFTIAAMEKQIEELAWRLNSYVETKGHAPIPLPS